MTDPWTVLGDFNDIVSPSERTGGYGYHEARFSEFSDHIQRCHLLDLGAFGPKFTWKGPKLRGGSRLYERLDSVLANEAFLSVFPECSVQVLTRTRFSDHNPICLKCVACSPAPVRDRPFRFEAMWIQHDSYLEFLKNSGVSTGNINHSFDSLQPLLSVWNKEVFGMIEQKKRSILNRLNGIQKASGYPNSEFLCKLELNLQEDLERLLKLEEIKWFQKSRGEWITKGDRNTKYYHLKAKMRNGRNKIVMLKDDLGNWIDDEEDLKALVINHFKSLYCLVTQQYSELTTRACFPTINPLILSNLATVPCDEEIRETLFSMGSYKAPGVDGFPPLFYKSNWSTVGSSLCEFVKKAFRREISLSKANETLISLIPKRDNVQLVSHFRPISLCMVHYKCITNLIAMRLREVMKDLVSPFQSIFIKGRCIQDNIIVGQEILHIMGKNRNKRGLMAIKIDLEKAYDQINWMFLKQVLLEVGLDGSFVEFIIDCVSSVLYNVLWNGAKTGFFCPSRGIRQGDPLSPLLFVLCMDKLSHLICDAVEDGRWKPIQVTNGGPSVSHLMFADDLLLFGIASEAQTLCMMNCIEEFMKASGGKVNVAKSSIFFSPKVPLQMKLRIKSMTHMHISNEIGRYLGFPLTRDRKSKEIFHYVIDRVKSKLSVWKANSLSMAGRITLAQSVLSTIPFYPMLVARLPTSVCLEVEHLQRNFIWGHDGDSRRFHSIGWDQITRPKEYGGLGLRRLCSVNKACNAKLAWKLVSGAKGLWAEILFHRYMVRDGESLLNYRPGDSKLWKFICDHSDLVDQGSKWQVQNGQVANFFHDCWIGNGIRLIDFCLRSLTEEEENTVVADWVVAGVWDIHSLSSIISSAGIRRVVAVLPPRPDAEPDGLVWGASSDGLFSIKSAYFLIEPNLHSLWDKLYKDIWKWGGAERIRVFMWKASLNKLPTNLWRSSWLHSSALCGACNTEIEDILHILRDCGYARMM
ncbi:hypothetical protein QN277_025768 [Acacia crassicarpa]|uniref:Reverse transcriptase domain-containing protein n=1 Tax=Acacia crassicarpa TaxID=499986 RepID=A0AAE1J6I7_9FABA|nr:hypothetical protein QN277_025768 [Acacia crassicarpa]